MSQKIRLFDMKVGLAKAETADYWEIEGLASSEDSDLQGEIIKQDGLDLTELNRKRLVFNDNHSKDTKDILGIVDNAEMRPNGLYVKGKLFKTNPSSQVYYNLLKHKGYVGFSVEGLIKKRESFNNKIVKEAKLTAIALTRYPVNEYTYARLLKSLSSPDNDDVQKSSAPIEPEGLASLPSGPVELTPEDKLQIQSEIFNFLKTFPAPTDAQMHEVANKLRIDEHKFEELVYEMLGNIGKHKDAKDAEFDQEQLSMGLKVEKEHTDNPIIAKEIAKDHLKEIPDYYSRLALMEDQAKSMEKGKPPMPDGTMKEWQGKKYKKEGGKWFEVSDADADTYLPAEDEKPGEVAEEQKADPKLVEEIKKLQDKHPNLTAIIAKIVGKRGETQEVYSKISEIVAPLKEKVVEKALAPGGPQYSGPPGDITGGGVFMSESNENSMRKKKLKNKVRQTIGAYKKLYRNASKEKIIKKTLDYFMSTPQRGYIAEEFAKGEKVSYKRQTEDKQFKKTDDLKELRKSILKEVIQRLKNSYPNMPYEQIVQLGLDIYNEKIRKIL